MLRASVVGLCNRRAMHRSQTPGGLVMRDVRELLEILALRTRNKIQIVSEATTLEQPSVPTELHRKAFALPSIHLNL